MNVHLQQREVHVMSKWNAGGVRLPHGPYMIGVGGIVTGDDIMDYIEAGASAVQITSLAHWAGDPRRFYEQILQPETSSRFLAHITDNT